jgi:hypothetical protein
MEGRLTKEAASVPRGTQIRISIGNFQYLATAANAFDHAVKRRVLAIDWIIWIIRQVLPRALDRPALGGGRPVPPAAIACPGSSMEVVRIDFAKELTGSHRHDVVTPSPDRSSQTWPILEKSRPNCGRGKVAGECSADRIALRRKSYRIRGMAARRDWGTSADRHPDDLRHESEKPVGASLPGRVSAIAVGREDESARLAGGKDRPRRLAEAFLSQ